jgi:hypothetical protein
VAHQDRAFPQGYSGVPVDAVKRFTYGKKSVNGKGEFPWRGGGDRSGFWRTPRARYAPLALSSAPKRPQLRSLIPSARLPARSLPAILPSLRVALAGISNPTSGADMKINVEVDCTPLEARQFFGLPDVQPMQTAVMDKLQQQLMANIEKVSPEALMQSWFTFDPKIAERFQDMFVTMAGLGTGLGGALGKDKK